MSGRPGRRSLAKIRRAVGEAFTRDMSVPVAAEWLVPADYVLPTEFSVGSFAGLIQCQVLHNDPSRLLTYWRSGDHLRSQSAAFVKAMGVESKAWHGEIADVRVRAISFWPTSVLGALMTLSAAIGAVTIVYQAYAYLFAPPEVSASVEAVQPIDASPDSSIRIPISFTNHSASGSARVELADFSTSAAGTGIDYGQRLFPLDPGERKEAPFTARTGKPGDVRLILHTKATSGWWRRQQTLPISVHLKIWPAQQRTDFYAVESECGSERCVMRSELFVGRREPTGLDCWAHVVGVPDVRMLWVSTASDGGGVPVETAVGDARLVKIDWHQQSSEAFRRHRIDIVMAGRIPFTAWKTVATKMVWLCAPTLAAGG